MRPLNISGRLKYFLSFFLLDSFNVHFRYSSSGNSSFYAPLEEADDDGVVQNAPSRISSRPTKNKRSSVGGSKF
jgi:hypothetical protein